MSTGDEFIASLTMYTLEPCPFCGKAPKIEESTAGFFNETRYYDIGCPNVECKVNPRTHEYFTTLQLAVDAWNSRSDPALATRVKIVHQERGL